MALPFASVLNDMNKLLYLVYGTDCGFYAVKEC